MFSTNWLLLLIIDKFTITEFAILIRNLSFLVPPSTLGEHIYGVSVILRKDIFQISPGWLPPLLLFWFTYLYHRNLHVIWKFTKNCTPSQVFFKEFHYSCRTAILKNVSWWLLLRAILFWEYSCMAASQKQLQMYIHFRNSYTFLYFLLWRHVKEGRIFMIFFFK